MTELQSERGFSCSLEAPAFRIREGEFGELFARFLRGVEVLDIRSARLLFDAAGEAELRELLARERRCCSFFEFEVEGAEQSVALLIRVPAGSEPALAFLLGLTHVARQSS